MRAYRANWELLPTSSEESGVRPSLTYPCLQTAAVQAAVQPQGVLYTYYDPYLRIFRLGIVWWEGDKKFTRTLLKYGKV